MILKRFKKRKTNEKIKLVCTALSVLAFLLVLTLIGCSAPQGGDDSVEKILLGGSFSTVGGNPHASIARLNSDGSEDSGFTIGTDDISAIDVQSDGKVLLGGDIMQVDGNPHAGIARLNADGSEDAGFTIGANSVVQAVVIQLY